MTKLWLLKRKDRIGYDEYDATVVAADTKEEAVLYHPAEGLKFDGRHWRYESGKISSRSDWGNIKELSVEYLGETDRDIKGPILSSFNAG